ncbi:MAG: response regulator [Planctomycetota bacterium]
MHSGIWRSKASSHGVGRVLVVDDDPNARASLERILSQAFKVEGAEGIAEALSLLEVGQFDVVIANCKLKDGTGPSLVDEVAERHPQIMTMIVTGDAYDPEVQRLQQDGRTLVIWKPVSAVDLLGWVRNAVVISRVSLAGS